MKKVTLFILMIAVILAGCNAEEQPISSSTEKPISSSTEKPGQSTLPAPENFAMGNSSNNIMRGGRVATDGEWIYCAMEDAEVGSSIAKMKIDGSERSILINDHAYSLNVKDGNIYYTSIREDEGYIICKISTSGGEKTVLSQDSADYLHLMGDYLYFLNYSDMNRPYRMKLDGSEKQKLSDRSCYKLTVGEGYLWFNENATYGINDVASSEENERYNEQLKVTGHLFRIKSDGSDEVKLLDKWIVSITVVDKTVYAMDNLSYVYSAPLEKNSFEMYGEYTRNDLVAYDSKHFYFSEDYFDENRIELGRISKMNIDSMEKQIINEQFLAIGVNIIDDTLFFINRSRGNSLYMMKTDGSDVRLVPGAVSGMVFDNPTLSDPVDRDLAELSITTEEFASCVKLFKVGNTTKGEEVRLVYINPKSKCVIRFPAGDYILKIAEGSEWISDEEAFGNSGNYITTDSYTFEGGGSYFISSGERGDFRNESASDFTR